MGSGSSSPPKPPPPPPPPPPIYTSKSLWDPVGEPGKLQACAAAWTGLGGSLKSIADSLESTTTHLGSSWSGSAYDDFQKWSGKYTRVLHDLAGDCSTMAGHLNATATYLEEKNAEIQHLYEALLATAAVGIGLSLITFGFSDAAAAAAGAAEAAEAEGILAQIGAYLSVMASNMGATLLSFAGRWAVAFGINVTINEAVSLWRTHSLDFGPNMWTSSINGATAFAAIPGGFLKDVPFSGAIKGGIAGLGGSVLTTTMDGDPFTINSLERDLLSVGISAGAGQAFDWIWSDPAEVDPASPGSQLIDPSTGLRFGEAPPPVNLVDGQGLPLDGSPAAPPGQLIDPSTGLPFGATPPPATLLGPTGEVVVGPAPDPAPLINPATGQPFNAPPGQLVVADSAGNVIGETPVAPLVGADGQPLVPPTPPAPGVSMPLPKPRLVVEGLLDKGRDVLVELIMPGPDGHYAVQTLILPAADIQSLGPAPIGAP